MNLDNILGYLNFKGFSKNFIKILTTLGSWMNNLQLDIQGKIINVGLGVLMGCFLSPLLFVLYYSFIILKNKLNQKLKIYFFADDTTIVTNKENTIRDYNIYTDSLKDDYLLINEDKTVIISK